MKIQSPSPDRPAPQAAETATVRWSASASGGVGARSYEFRLRRDGGEEKSVAAGPSPVWDWTPAAEGLYRGRVIVSDERGNRAEGPWSGPFEIVSRLTVSMSPDRPGPQMVTAAIRWSALAEGGVGEKVYTFSLRNTEGREKLVQVGPDPGWEWRPEEAGRYRVAVAVTDERGNTAGSEWSAAYEIAPPLQVTSPKPDRPSPQTATTRVRWEAAAAGGVGERAYSFWLEKDAGEPVLVHTGREAALAWTPEESGAYRMRLRVVDGLGNAAESPWSAAYTVAPKLVAESLSPDRESPQAAEMATVRWSASASGGVGARSYEFRLRRDGDEEKSVAAGPSPVWDWTPAAEGLYRGRVIVSDERGNRAEGPWSGPFEIVSRLTVSMSPDRPGPQMVTAAIRWSALAEGGVGERTYVFELAREDGRAHTILRGPDPLWTWIPLEAGTYRVRVRVTDALGNVVESPWAAPYEVAPKLTVTSPASDRPAPQMATTRVRWDAAAAGGVGERRYVFWVTKDGQEPVRMKTGPEPFWEWTPDEAGSYRVAVVAVDSLGNRGESRWTPPYEIAPPLQVTSPKPDRPSPQTATTRVRWEAAAAGGVGERAYSFWLEKDAGEPVLVHTGREAALAWTPEESGAYRMRLRVVDGLGNAAESPWSAAYTVAPKLVAESLSPDRESPQAAEMATVVWSARARGGVGAHTYTFVLSDPGGEQVVQEGPSPVWAWKPSAAGRFRVKAAVLDALGNRAESDWSSVYEVVPPLVVRSLSPDRPAPQAAKLGAITWSAAASGGVGGHAFEFLLSDGKEEMRVQAGATSSWEWLPEKAGTYRVKAAVLDALGNRAESDWSSPYAVSGKLAHTVPIAILPVENLSGTAAPLKKIRGLLMEGLETRGFTVLANDVLEEFMARHRIRYTGGIDREDARKLKEETGAGAALITSVELYSSTNPPKIAATSRLVATEGDRRRILWMDSIGLAGDRTPGLLGLGLIKDPDILVQAAAENLSDSLAVYLSEDSLRSGARGRKRTFQPKMQYGSVADKEKDDLALAVVPFYNLSSRSNAGEILSLHFTRSLKEFGSLSVVEPGDVRTSLLGSRVILDDGISLANADLISNRLDVDLILTGRVFDYQDYQGPSGTTKIDFSVLVLERKSRKVIWYSRSGNYGNDRVYLFDWGTLKTANELVVQMVDAIVHSMLE